MKGEKPVVEQKTERVRTLSTRRARKLSKMRKHFGGGRPAVPMPCPRCGAECASTRLALGHDCEMAKLLKSMKPKPEAVLSK